MSEQSATLSSRRLARRLRDLNVRHWLLLAETLAMLAGASMAIALLPFRRVVQLASGQPKFGDPQKVKPNQVDELLWAVEAVARRVPWRTVCFQKGLALHLMLRRNAIASVLHYGVGKKEDGALAAHVWISVDGQIVQGGNVVDKFHCLVRYPSDP